MDVLAADCHVSYVDAGCVYDAKIVQIEGNHVSVTDHDEPIHCSDVVLRYPGPFKSICKESRVSRESLREGSYYLVVANIGGFHWKSVARVHKLERTRGGRISKVTVTAPSIVTSTGTEYFHWALDQFLCVASEYQPFPLPTSEPSVIVAALKKSLDMIVNCNQFGGDNCYPACPNAKLMYIALESIGLLESVACVRRSDLLTARITPLGQEVLRGNKELSLSSGIMSSLEGAQTIEQLEKRSLETRNSIPEILQGTRDKFAALFDEEGELPRQLERQLTLFLECLAREAYNDLFDAWSYWMDVKYRAAVRTNQQLREDNAVLTRTISTLRASQYEPALTSPRPRPKKRLSNDSSDDGSTATSEEGCAANADGPTPRKKMRAEHTPSTSPFTSAPATPAPANPFGQSSDAPATEAKEESPMFTPFGFRHPSVSGTPALMGGNTPAFSCGSSGRDFVDQIMTETSVQDSQALYDPSRYGLGRTELDPAIDQSQESESPQSPDLLAPSQPQYGASQSPHWRVQYANRMNAMNFGRQPQEEPSQSQGFRPSFIKGMQRWYK